MASPNRWDGVTVRARWGVGCCPGEVKRTGVASPPGGMTMEDGAHPNLIKTQETWDALARGEIAGLDDQADDIVVENGPGAGPWRVVQGKEAFVNFVMQSSPSSRERGIRTDDASTPMTDAQSRWCMRQGADRRKTSSTTWPFGSPALTLRARQTGSGPSTYTKRT